VTTISVWEDFQTCGRHTRFV